MVASWLGTKMASGRENYPMLLSPIGPFNFGMALLHGPSIWGLAPDILFPTLLNLAAIDMKLMAVNWNFRFGHSVWVQRPWQEIKERTWFWLATSLSHCLGLHFICHQWGCLSDMGMPPTGEKGSDLPPRTTKLGNLRDGHNPSSSHCWTRSSGFFSCVLSPPGDARNVTGSTGMLGELVGSHTKVVIYPTYAICWKRLWSMPCWILGSRACR